MSTTTAISSVLITIFHCNILTSKVTKILYLLIHRFSNSNISGSAYYNLLINQYSINTLIR